MSLRVSVALATFNGGGFVAEQIASILGQDRLPDEIIVSDDGSSDETLKIVRAALIDANGVEFTVLANEGGSGVTGNFERAIAACSGDVVILSDQDDKWHPNRISTALARFDADDRLALHHANARLVDGNGRPLGVTLFDALRVTATARARINSGRAFQVYLRRNLATGAVMAFRRELFDRAAPLPREWLHDEWLAIVAAATGATSVSETCLIDYRQHDSNQVGVSASTPRYRIGRMLRPDPERNAALARRSRILVERLSRIPGVSPEFQMEAAGKARFEAARADLPRVRLARIPGIFRAARDASYRRFSSQGRLDVARDLLQRR